MRANRDGGNGLGQADIEFDVQRPGDLILKELPDSAMLGVNPPHQLAFVPAERNPVIPMSGAGLPGGLLFGNRRRHLVGVGQRLQVQRFIDGAHPGLMA